MTRQVSMEDILFGVGHGRSQSVGNMEVIPLVDEDGVQDENFESPDAVEVGTSDYGTVNVRNGSDGPTIVPPGAGWVVKQAAQDHAIGGGTLLKKGQSKRINTARCIQSSQGGYISNAAHEMLILPVGLRSKALALRSERGYDRLWGDIAKFNSGFGISSRSELVYFLKNFDKQLDRFVAEFELVPRQVGAVILINGMLVGIEMAPSVKFWSAVWSPLIRVCYGSFAIRHADKAVPNRKPLGLEEKSLDGIRSALEAAGKLEAETTNRLIQVIRSDKFMVGTVDDQMDKYSLMTVGYPKASLGGQMVLSESKRTAPYLSVCVNAE